MLVSSLEVNFNVLDCIVASWLCKISIFFLILDISLSEISEDDVLPLLFLLGEDGDEDFLFECNIVSLSSSVVEPICWFLIFLNKKSNSLSSSYKKLLSSCNDDDCACCFLCFKFDDVELNKFLLPSTHFCCCFLYIKKRNN